MKFRTHISGFFTKIRKNKYILYTISLSIFFIAWHCISLSKALGRITPSPFEVLKQIGVLSVDALAGSTLFGHLWASMHRVLIAFFVAVIVGIPLGLLMGFSRHVNAIVRPIFEIFKTMPPIAWISLAILWFGVGEKAKIFIILIGAIIPCIINAFNGIRLVDPLLYDAFRLLGGSRKQSLFEVSFPAAMPAIFAGIQLSLSFGWTCVVAAELVGARKGMGFLIILGMNISRPALIIGGMAVIALVAWFISAFLGWLEKIICPWKREL